MTIRPLRELADIQTGPFGSQLHKEDYVEIGTPIVTVEHLGKRVFSEQNLPLVSEADKQRLSKYLLAEGDIVFSRVGSVDRCSYNFNLYFISKIITLNLIINGDITIIIFLVAKKIIITT